MKIRNPRLIRLVGRIGAWLIYLWMSTLRYRYRPIGLNVDPGRRDLPGRYIYAFWHENMLMLAYAYGRPDIWVLISSSADGQLIADVASSRGFNVVRGSSTRDFAGAVRKMIEMGRGCHLAITPDGPRGPRRQAQQGVAFLASHTGLPVIPIGIGYRRAWRLGSWDRFAVPVPGTFATCVTAEPMSIPPDADREQLLDFRRRIEQRMEMVQTIADSWATTGTWPEELAAACEAGEDSGDTRRRAG